MTLCRWYCSVAFWAGKPHNNYVNVKICKMPIMRCTHSFPSSIRIGKNTKGLKNLSWTIYSGRELLTRWGGEPCRVQLKLDQNNRGRRGKLWLLLLKCFKNTFGSQKSIISFLSCIACFKTHSQPILLFNFAKFLDYIKGINHSRQHSQLEIEKYSVLLCDPGSEAAAGVSSNVSHISAGHPDQISSEWIMSLLSHRLQPKDFTSYQILEIFLQKSSIFIQMRHVFSFLSGYWPSSLVHQINSFN